ncbi:helix-turn-helix domain-containing protein, partial [Streptomyces sp. IF17]
VRMRARGRPARERAAGVVGPLRPLTLEELARRASMSVRTLSRRFRQETGVTPIRWLTHQRIQQACRLLEGTDLPVDTIAARTGFGTGSAMRQRFRETIGVSPRAYRATFRGTVQSAEPTRQAGGPDTTPV